MFWMKKYFIFSSEADRYYFAGLLKFDIHFQIPQ